MSKLAISQTPTTITVVDQQTAKVYTITNTQPTWSQVVEAIKNEDNDDEILQLISVKNHIESVMSNGNISVEGNDVKYKGHVLAGLDVDHLLEAVRTGNKRQAKALAMFLENKQLNPSYRAINMMYKFRQDKGMPLTDDGCFLAYKGVLKDYWSKNANPNTIVLCGQVNTAGQILNSIGAYIEVDRKCVEDDPAKGCGEGLHAGSLEYATGWGERVVIVKIHPKDVVSVPDAEDNKMRVCAYSVVGECEGRMPEHFDKKLDTDDTDENVCPDCGCEIQPDEEGCDNCGWEPELDGEDDEPVYPEDTINCPDCGHDIPTDDNKLCSHCGWDGNSPDSEDWDTTEVEVESDEEECGCSCCEQEECESQGSVCDDSQNTDVTSYDEGWTKGTRDGRGKVKRAYYEGDELAVVTNTQASYIKGYNVGYKLARYGKS